MLTVLDLGTEIGSIGCETIAIGRLRHLNNPVEIFEHNFIFLKKEAPCLFMEKFTCKKGMTTNYLYAEADRKQKEKKKDNTSYLIEPSEVERSLRGHCYHLNRLKLIIKQKRTTNHY